MARSTLCPRPTTMGKDAWPLSTVNSPHTVNIALSIGAFAVILGPSNEAEADFPKLSLPPMKKCLSSTVQRRHQECKA